MDRIDWDLPAFINSCRRLSPAETGVYTMLICLAYLYESTLENNDRWLSAMCGNMRTNEFVKIKTQLIIKRKLMIVQTENGDELLPKGVHDRMTIALRRMQARKDAGQMGGQARAKRLKIMESVQALLEGQLKQPLSNSGSTNRSNRIRNAPAPAASKCAADAFGTVSKRPGSPPTTGLVAANTAAALVTFRQARGDERFRGISDGELATALGLDGIPAGYAENATLSTDGGDNGASDTPTVSSTPCDREEKQDAPPESIGVHATNKRTKRARTKA